MWKPVAVVAAVGSVSLHLTIMNSYSNGPTEEKEAPQVHKVEKQVKGQANLVSVGPAMNSQGGPRVKVSDETFLVFPDGTRVVANTATKNLMIIDLSVPMDIDALNSAIRSAILQTPVGQKVEEKSQNRSIQVEFWSRKGSGQIVLDEISEGTTSVSIRIYGEDLFART